MSTDGVALCAKARVWSVSKTTAARRIAPVGHETAAPASRLRPHNWPEKTSRRAPRRSRTRPPVVVPAVASTPTVIAPRHPERSVRSRPSRREAARDAGREALRGARLAIPRLAMRRDSRSVIALPPIATARVDIGVAAVGRPEWDVLVVPESVLRRYRLRIRDRRHHRRRRQYRHQEPSGKKSSSHGVGLLGPRFRVAQGAGHRGRRDSSTTAGFNRYGCVREGTP
jgi:hypothetical protein